MSRNTNLQVAGGSLGEGNGVGVGEVFRLSLLLSLDEICMQKAAILILLGFLNFILIFFFFF